MQKPNEDFQNTVELLKKATENKNNSIKIAVKFYNNISLFDDLNKEGIICVDSVSTSITNILKKIS